MFKDKFVVVIGLARSGISVAKVFVNLGANVLITDQKSEKNIADNLVVVAGFEGIKERLADGSVDMNAKYGGTGLGLSISKKLIENLGGKMWFESETGVGSSFYFSIPFEDSAKISTEQDAKPDIISQNNWKNKRILIAEDAVTNFKFLEAVLERTNAQITWAKDGKEVLDNVDKTPDFDLILMDIQMPILNGHEALKQLKLKGIQIPIIAQTAYAMETDRQEIIDLGYDDYIIKPIEINLLLNKISKFLNK